MKKQNLPILIGVVIGPFIYGLMVFISFTIIMDTGMGEKSELFYGVLSKVGVLIVSPLMIFRNPSNPISSIIFGIIIIGSLIGAIVGKIIKSRQLKA